MTTVKDYETSLVERFVASFAKLDDMIAFDSDRIASQLAIGEPNERGFKRWSPWKVNTNAEYVESVYSKLPAPFPRIFERLVLSYRWAEVEVGSCCLLANPPGPDLTGLLEQMSKDKFLWNCLLKAGYIRFAVGPGGDYDPVCFDTKSRKKNRDYRIVKIDHEEILCNERVKIVAEIAPSFADLAAHTIQQADSVRGIS